jgi:flavin reductase (DIM6/NTAB) family NADH-FMN oxidoreductase RutF
MDEIIPSLVLNLMQYFTPGTENFVRMKRKKGFLMTKQKIDQISLYIAPHHLFDVKSVLLTCGDLQSGKFNAMTIGWGAIGTRWSKPAVWVAVRPSRFTFEFMEKYQDFTLTVFPDSYSAALSLLGTKSGRDGNKIEESGLTPMPSMNVGSPTYQEAELSIECQKIYWQDLQPSNFLDPTIIKSYPNQNFHRMYIGEIVSIQGEDQYIKKAVK